MLFNYYFSFYSQFLLSKARKARKDKISTRLFFYWRSTRGRNTREATIQEARILFLCHDNRDILKYA